VRQQSGIGGVASAITGVRNATVSDKARMIFMVAL
jgi:hypothetical protein